jgi:hypothetical protein
MAIIETNGLSDRVAYAQVMSNIKGAYNNYGVGDGNFPNAKGILTDRILSNIWLKALIDKSVFADGKGVTKRTGVEGCSSVRVPIMAPPPYAMRTLTIATSADGALQGTPGNDGLENNNLPNIPQTNGVDVYLNQLFDNATVIPQLSQDMVSLPIAGEYTGNIPKTVSNMEDSTILAIHMKAGLARAAGADNSNLVPVDLSNNTEGYLQQALNKLIGTMVNPQTSWSEGVVSYDLDDSVIVMKQSFFDLIFSVRNGALVSASDVAQRMLLGGAITEDGMPRENFVRGVYSGVNIKVVPDSYWRQAAALCGIQAANTFAQFDKVQAYIANAQGFAFGRASASINPIPNPGNAIGTKIQTLFRWGVANTRPSACGLIIATETGTLSDFVNPVNSLGAIVAPNDFNAAIKALGFTNTDYGTPTSVGVNPDGEGGGNGTTLDGMCIVYIAGLVEDIEDQYDGIMTDYCYTSGTEDFGLTATPLTVTDENGNSYTLRGGPAFKSDDADTDIYVLPIGLKSAESNAPNTTYSHFCIVPQGSTISIKGVGIIPAGAVGSYGFSIEFNKTISIGNAKGMYVDNIASEH